MTDTNPRIGVIFERDKHPSAKRLADLTTSEIAETLLCDWSGPLSEALSVAWTQDAHLITYRVDADATGKEVAFARASKRSPFISQLEKAGGRVRVTILALDYDLPKHADGAKQEWSDDTLDEFVQVFQQAVVDSKVPEPSVFYTTLHGSRLVYVLAEEATPGEAEGMLLGLLDAYARVGIELDPKCKDWTRLFRLPSTTRQDSGVPYAPRLLLTDGPDLVAGDCPALAPERATLYADVDQFVGDMPDADDCKELLERKLKGGGYTESELAKKAKLYLAVEGPRPTPYPYAIVFENEPIVRGEDNWNATVMTIVGTVIGAISRQSEASPEGVYALLYSALEQLQHREDQGEARTNWYTTAWDMVCRVWSNEMGKLEAEREEEAEEQRIAEGVREDLIEKARDEQPELVPATPEEAAEWLNARLIAIHKNNLFVMRADGTYNENACVRQELVSQIRDLGMVGVIPIVEVRGKTTCRRDPGSIIDAHGIPISKLCFDVNQELSRIDGTEGRRVLHMPLYRLNPKLAPGGRFSKVVDEWLQLLAGDSYHDLIEWLAHSLDYRRPICALNLSGAPGTGKGLLTIGLKECFDGAAANDGRVLGKWNGGLKNSPVIICDEGVPKISSDENLPLDQAFRNLVTGGNITIREMQTNPYSATLYPRIVFTSNDMEILTEITGNRDLTEFDLIALQQRILSIDVDEAAQLHLVTRGGHKYTATWVQSKQLHLANHILYLYENRTPSARGGDRLLVEGDTKSEVLQDQRYASAPAQLAVEALIKVVEAPGGRSGFHQYGGRLWVTSQGLKDFAVSNLQHGDLLNLRQASRVLTNALCLKEEIGKPTKVSIPPGADKKSNRLRWVEVDLFGLYRLALKNGTNALRLRGIIADREGGPELLEALEE